MSNLLLPIINVYFNVKFKLIDLIFKYKLQLKGIRVGAILINKHLVLKVIYTGRGTGFYWNPDLDYTYGNYVPAFGVEILKDSSEGEHLTGAIMNNYVTLTSNESMCAFELNDLKVFNLRLATKVERLLYAP